MTFPLGRIAPPDNDHVVAYPLRAVQPGVVMTAERILKLPSWRKTHDQGQEGSCVGHGSAMERAIVNTAQRTTAQLRPFTRRYDPIWLWNESKLTDGYPDTNPGDDNGTTVRAAYDVLRLEGAVRCRTMRLVNGIPTPSGDQPVDLAEGVLANRWATQVDELRTALAVGQAVTIGVNWYSAFDSPIRKGTNSWWLPEPPTLGTIRGGHCVCLYGASDRRQAFRMVNSWGVSYPLTWLPYSLMQRLLNEQGEAVVATDR